MIKRLVQYLAALMLIGALALGIGCSSDAVALPSEPEPVSIGDTYQEVLNKTGIKPTGELNRDGVNILLFGSAKVKLQGEVVIDVDAEFEAKLLQYKSSFTKKQ